MLFPQNKQTKKKKGQEETFVSDDYVYYLDCSDGFISMHISKLMKFYTLNMSGFLYINYTSIQLFKNFFHKFYKTYHHRNIFLKLLS